MLCVETVVTVIRVVTNVLQTVKDFMNNDKEGARNIGTLG
jgi:hypothetical protein